MADKPVNGGSRPVPDPTFLTTQAQEKDSQTIKDLIEVEIRHRRELTDEMFKAVDERLKALSDRTAEQKADTKQAVDAALVAAEKAVAAALAAAKEAVGQQTEASERAIAKSEASTSKNIDTLAILQQANTTAMDDKIGDMKSRLDRIESTAVGSVQAVAEGRNSTAAQRAMFTFGITAVLFLITIAGFVIALIQKP